MAGRTASRGDAHRISPVAKHSMSIPGTPPPAAHFACCPTRRDAAALTSGIERICVRLGRTGVVTKLAGRYGAHVVR
jgi:hypothetical protein